MVIKEAVGTTALVNTARTMLMDEIEELRQAHGVRREAAVALVAERHGLSTSALDMVHFHWTLEVCGLSLDEFIDGLATMSH